MKNKWPNEMLICRHGQSEANVRKDAAKARGEEPAWTGVLRDMDSPLTELGHRQGYSLGVHLRQLYPATMGYPFHGKCKGGMLQYIVTSPYLRSRQTTDEIIRGLDYTPEVVVDERLREIDFGIMDGIDRKRFRELFPSEADRRERDGKYWYRPPGGENRPDVRQRIHGFLDTLNRDYVDTKTLISCHSVVVLAFRSLLERWGEAEYMQVDKEDDVKNCGLTIYKRQDRRRLKLQEYNTVALPIGTY
jgi:broad specificity phosphatase PhoE